jgi:acetyl/propionyl-CoA carboxylase alpha subunit
MLAFGEAVLDIVAEGDGYAISQGGATSLVKVVEEAEGRMVLLIDGRRVVATVSADGQRQWVTVGGQTVVLTKSSARRKGAASHDDSSELSAPMPGQVRAVNVKSGEKVSKGQVLIILEAMKMEIRVQAPFDGLVSAVNAQVGQTVEREQMLVKMQQA